MPRHQGLERRLSGLAAAGEESVQELGVGEVPDHPDTGEVFSPLSSSAPAVRPTIGRVPCYLSPKSAG